MNIYLPKSKSNETQNKNQLLSDKSHVMTKFRPEFKHQFSHKTN